MTSNQIFLPDRLKNFSLVAGGRQKQRGLLSGAVRGFTLIELMVAIALGLLIVLALTTLFVNVSRTNSEMAKTNAQIENGRFAMQLLRSDIVHGGFWGGYVPAFDDLTMSAATYDAATMKPSAVPNPCLEYNATNWTTAYKNNLIAIPIQSYDNTLPSGAGCVTNLATNKQSNTDVLVVRHASTCLPGEPNCETVADSANKLYFQMSLCENEISATVQAATTTTITLASFASAVDDFYNGSVIRIVSGPGLGQSRVISDYNGSTRVATVSPAWSPLPDNTSGYAFGSGYVLDKSGHVLHKKDCATVADKRKFISNIYYIRNYAVTAGDGIPTLMRSSFDGTTPAHQEAVPLIEGIEGFRVELGIDSLGDRNPPVTGTPTVVDYSLPLVWADPINRVTPLNRGDGIPDGSFVRCTAAAPCTADQLANVVAVKIYVLARNKEATVGYTDGKTYTLGGTTLGPFNDHYKRHVFSTTVRLTNISSRRETP